MATGFTTGLNHKNNSVKTWNVPVAGTSTNVVEKKFSKFDDFFNI